MLPEKSRDDILATARRICAGGPQPTMEELAAAAGVGTRTLYRLFGSRESLFREAGCAAEPTARQRILDTALEEIGRRGLADLSMDDFATAAGVSRATLYRLFPGKSALFGELVRSFSPWEPVADVLDAMPNAPAQEVMPAVGRAIVEAMDGRVGVLLRMVFEMLRGDPDTAEGMQSSMSRGLPNLVTYLRTQMESGNLREMHPVVAFQLLAGPIVVHLLTLPLAENLLGFETPQAVVIDEIVDAWLRAMTP
jgi:AcrR family transcriptional regulator